MHKAIRYLRLALTAPFVLLAIAFDWASAMMHKAADWLSPKDKVNGAHRRRDA
jgi:hypothetical protein